MKSTHTSVSYFLPAIGCSFPWAVNDHYADSLHAEMFSWALSLLGERSDLTQRQFDYEYRSNFALWCAMLYPFAERDDLIPWCRLTYFLTMIYDSGEQGWAPRPGGAGREGDVGGPSIWSLFTHAMEQLGQGGEQLHPGDEPLPHALLQTLVSLVDDAIRKVGGTLRTKFLEAVLAQVRSQVDLASWRERPAKLSLTGIDTYLAYRSGNYGTQIYTPAIPALAQADVSEHEIADPRFGAIDQLAHRHMWLTNDLYSLRKEYCFERGEVESMRNLVSLKVLHEKITWQESVDAVIRMVDQTESRMVRDIEAWARGGASEGLRKYFEALQYFVAGNLRYQLTSPRYHGVDFTGAYTSRTVVCDPRKDRECF